MPLNTLLNRNFYHFFFQELFLETSFFLSVILEEEKNISFLHNNHHFLESLACHFSFHTCNKYKWTTEKKKQKVKNTQVSSLNEQNKREWYVVQYNTVRTYEMYTALHYSSIDVAKGQKIYLFSIFIVSILSCFILLCRTKCALSVYGSVSVFFFFALLKSIHIFQAKGLFLPFSPYFASVNCMWI